jgi:hypothetical protein
MVPPPAATCSNPETLEFPAKLIPLTLESVDVILMVPPPAATFSDPVTLEFPAKLIAVAEDSVDVNFTVAVPAATFNVLPIFVFPTRSIALTAAFVEVKVIVLDPALAATAPPDIARTLLMVVSPASLMASALESVLVRVIFPGAVIATAPSVPAFALAFATKKIPPPFAVPVPAEFPAVATKLMAPPLAPLFPVAVDVPCPEMVKSVASTSAAALGREMV